MHDWEKKTDDGRCATSYTLLRFSDMAFSENGGVHPKVMAILFLGKRKL